VAFTTETKNRAYARAVHQHPAYGRTVLLIRDQDMGDLHHDRMYGHNKFLYRHGGYRWDGTAWHRPGRVLDRACEGYDARRVEDAVTVTAAEPSDPGRGKRLGEQPEGSGGGRAAACAGATCTRLRAVARRLGPAPVPGSPVCMGRASTRGPACAGSPPRAAT